MDFKSRPIPPALPPISAATKASIGSMLAQRRSRFYQAWILTLLIGAALAVAAAILFGPRYVQPTMLVMLPLFPLNYFFAVPWLWLRYPTLDRYRQ
jgi:hypothetical protein